jgi:type II secretory pathway pseudopilin PulG
MKCRCVRSSPRSPHQTGFALVGLLVAIVVSALLVAILLPGLPNASAAASGWKFNNTLGSDFQMAADRN